VSRVPVILWLRGSGIFTAIVVDADNYKLSTTTIKSPKRIGN